MSVSELKICASTFTISGFAALSEEERNSRVKLLLPEKSLRNWGLVNSTVERASLNTLMLPVWARECIQKLDSGEMEVKVPAMEGFGCSKILKDSDGAYLGGLMGPISITTGNIDDNANLMQVTPENCSFLDAAFSQQWNMAKNGEEFRSQLEILSSSFPASCVYYKACEKLLIPEDLPQDANQEGGFFASRFWNEDLLQFQRDGVLSLINTIEKHNGCILADSVGLGKTYEALAVIKYYESQRKRALVLAPKRLIANWSIFKENVRTNPYADEPFKYDLLKHTDLPKDGPDWANFRWEAYDLVVVDESHNFRNHRTQQYQALMNKVIKGCQQKTKVLLLSATPVNNKVADLRNQINLISANQDNFLLAHGIESVMQTTRKADACFNEWINTVNDRSTASLARNLGQDYLKLLDLLTVARSRHHVKMYYPGDEKATFPERLVPINKYPSEEHGAVLPISLINDLLLGVEDNGEYNGGLRMASYRPLRYLKREFEHQYAEKYDQKLPEVHFRQSDREKQLGGLMLNNLFKRMESSVHSFAKTLDNMIQSAQQLLDALQNENTEEICAQAGDEEASLRDQNDELRDLVGNGRIQVQRQHVNVAVWVNDLESDISILNQAKEMIRHCVCENDAKLGTLREMILDKQNRPINAGNKKVLIFSVFTDTVKYIYNSLQQDLREHGLHMAYITGSGNGSNLDDLRNSQEDILCAFSPRSKKANVDGPQIDVLVATDCISEGQNLQDCDYLINYDIHWNPTRIIQRFGRVDRIGSTNTCLQLVNMWPMSELDEYIGLERRVRGRMAMLDLAGAGFGNVLEVENDPDFDFRSSQLRRMQDSVEDLDDSDEVATLSHLQDLNMQQYRADFRNYRSAHEGFIENLPPYFSSVLDVNDTTTQTGAFFLLRSHRRVENPYYLVRVRDLDGELSISAEPKPCLDELKKIASMRESVDESAVNKFNGLTENGYNMQRCRDLLSAAVQHISGHDEQNAARSIFVTGGTLIGRKGKSQSLNDFEVLGALYLV